MKKDIKDFFDNVSSKNFKIMSNNGDFSGSPLSTFFDNNLLNKAKKTIKNPFFISSIAENALLQNNSNINFEDKARDLNVLNTGWAWGVNFSDFDLDRDEDLFVLNGYDLGKKVFNYKSYSESLNKLIKL